MANSKSAKIRAEMEKVKTKMGELQAKYRELEGKHREAENEEIVDIIRSMKIPLEELPLVLQRLNGGGAASGHKVQKPGEEESE